MQLATAYQPSTSLGRRVARRLAPIQGRRILRFKLTRPLVSFTFDDCPVSAVDNGLSKLEAEGWRGTVYIASGLLGTTNHHGLQMNGDDVKSAFDRGHEIGGHSYSHIDATDTDFDTFIKDENRNLAALAALGLPACRTFAYPFGQTHRALKTRLAKDYDGLRGITSGPMINQADLNQIRSTPLFAGQDFEKAMAQIRALQHTPAWVTLFTHDITENPTQWGCTPAQMDSAINAVKEVGADVLPVADAIDFLKANS
jgi:peptidoglycan/xylan/chitin deacetylase (PgdA/CDA1 family)